VNGPVLLTAAWFVNPALLGGLGLVALPVLIHLLSRRQFRRIEWGATRFLLEAEKESRRRVRFEQWLLLALRCLALALLVLLVARPFVQPGLVAALLGSRGHTQRVVVIDDSASLAFRTERGPDFALLRESALRLLGWLGDGAPDDPITVYLTSRPTEPLAAGERLSAANLVDLRARVERLKPSNVPARPRRVLEAVAEDLAAAGPGTRADLYVLSDFQRSEWLAVDTTEPDGADEVPAGGSVFAPLESLEAGAVRVVLIATGKHARDNAALLDAQLERPQTVAGLPAVINAKVVNHSHRMLADAHVQVEVDGAPLPPVPVTTIPPGKSQTVAVEVTFPDEGFSEVTVGVDAVDGLPADNTRRLALPVARAVQVLLINGQPATDPIRDEVYFLRNALAPAGPFSSGVSVQTSDPEELEAIALEPFDCIMLCNVKPPGQDAVAALQRYVRAGGGLVFFLGENVGDPADYNRLFHAGGAGLLPLPLETLYASGAGPGGGAGVGLVRTGDHPITAMFPARSDVLSEFVRFRAYYRCVESEPPPVADAQPDEIARAAPHAPATERPPARTLARFTDAAQSPALVERAFGRGRVLLFTSSADLDWNDWARAADGSYVVTMLELVQYSARRRDVRTSFVAGETLALSILPEEYEPSGVFRAPAAADEPATEARVRGPVAAVGEPVVLEGPIAAWLGTYTAELIRRDGSVERRPLCVNLDETEFDLATAGAHELALALGNVPHEVLQAADSFRQDDAQARRELWPAVLVALVTVLMVEQSLAWWFGTPARVARRRRRMAPPLTVFGGGGR
jgi:hypothetical protein